MNQGPLVSIVLPTHNGARYLGQAIQSCIDQTYDLIVLPGGMPGAEHLRDCQPLIAMLKEQREENRYYAAICASPAVVLEHHGLLEGKKATAYPGFSDRLNNQEAVQQRVVVDGRCVTSRGPGTAMEFSLMLVSLLFGQEKATAIAEGLMAHHA